jgi:hypothetical protein
VEDYYKTIKDKIVNTVISLDELSEEIIQIIGS